MLVIIKFLARNKLIAVGFLKVSAVLMLNIPDSMTEPSSSSEMPNGVPTQSNGVGQWYQEAVENFGKPILESLAFKRLEAIRFLGALSPYYARKLECPHSFAAIVPEVGSDGTRADHSVQVATIALTWARKQRLSLRGQRILVAWGLLHDIATWPMSHTSEPAFSRLLGVSARELRERMIVGDRRVPPEFHICQSLTEMELSPDSVLQLFSKSTPPAEPEARLCWQWIRSVITPDTLEGMERSAKAFGCLAPPPFDVVTSHLRAEPEHGQVWVYREGLSAIAAFWQAKSAIYANYINRADVVRWESMLSSSIETAFSDVTLCNSLSLTEQDVIQQIQMVSKSSDDVKSSLRYKPPQHYNINIVGLDKLWLSGQEWFSLADLGTIFYANRNHPTEQPTWIAGTG
jgi:hypothetical protein